MTQNENQLNYCKPKQKPTFSREREREIEKDREAKQRLFFLKISTGVCVVALKTEVCAEKQLLLEVVQSRYLFLRMMVGHKS